MAAFDNPEFYKNKRLGYSNYYNFSAVYLGKDIDGYIQIPRGLRENIIQECEKAGISVDVSDQRETGQPIRVSFKGDLRMQQELAAEKLLSHSDGVLSAATAFGKTVVCSYLIAERKVASDIYYFETVDNKVFAYCRQSVYEVKERLYQLEEVIEELPFMRISKSMIVNIEKILHISPALGGRFEAVLENDEKVIISRLYVPILKNKLGVSR